jgi:hypothetical protein
MRIMDKTLPSTTAKNPLHTLSLKHLGFTELRTSRQLNRSLHKSFNFEQNWTLILMHLFANDCFRVWRFVDANLKILYFTESFFLTLQMSQETDDDLDDQPVVKKQPEKWGKFEFGTFLLPKTDFCVF